MLSVSIEFDAFFLCLHTFPQLTCKLSVGSSDAGLGLIRGSTLLGGVWLGAALCFHDQAPFL